MLKIKSLHRIIVFLCVLVVLVLWSFPMIYMEEMDVPGWETNVSRNLNDYIQMNELTTTLIPNDFCDKPSFLVIMCISRPSGFEARDTIRRTWGKDRRVMGRNVSLYFLIGQTTDLNLQTQIDKEFLKFGDIVQENFCDTYNNLTIKSAMMLKLFTTKCRGSAAYLLKVDDDIYLNVPLLVNDLVSRGQTENLLMGSVICKSRPIRSFRDKWYAGPVHQFPDRYYPNYISGSSYCMSGDVAEKLLSAALMTPVFHLEDVYLTGMCAKKIGLRLTHNGRFTFHNLTQNLCLYKPMITIHYRNAASIQKIHDSFKDPEVEKRCQMREELFLVHKWLVNNVLLANKTKRRLPCS